MSLSIKSCKRCKRLFQYTNNNMCPECVRGLDEIFLKVRGYLEKKPNASMIEVIEETGVEEKDIIDFLKEGRLSYAPSGAALNCEKCGKPIQSGRMCDSCKAELSNALSGSLAKTKESKDGKRSTTDDDKNKGYGMHVKISD